MDGDGQNEPGDIMRLVGRLVPEDREPAMVEGIREGSAHAKLPRVWPTGPRQSACQWLPNTGCGLKVYRRAAYLEVPPFTSVQRYLPASSTKLPLSW